LKVKTTTKEEYDVDVAGPDSKVGELRTVVKQTLSTPDDKETCLIHLGKVLADDEAVLSQLGIGEGGLVVVILKKKQASGAPAQLPVQPAATPPAPNPAPAPNPDAAPAPTPASPAPDAPAPSGEMLQLSVTNVEGDVRPLSAESNETVANIKAVLEIEFGIPMDRQQLTFEGKILSNEQTLSAAGVKNNDMMMVQAMRAPRQAAGAGAGGAGGQGGLASVLGNFFGQQQANPLQRYMAEAQQLLQVSASDPHFKTRIREQNQPLAVALDSGQPEEVAKVIADIHKAKRESEAKKAAAIMRLNADPFNAEAQKEIEEAIRMENVNQNLETAMEYNPESFGRVVMLYVDSEVNGVPVKAFVDSGAQSTIMSQVCAERLGLMRLIDYRYAGIAKGVGTSKIIGRVHSAEMKIGDMYFTVSITVLEDNSMEFLFGLDNLRRHQMCIDLKDNVLRAGEASVPFLGETDIPKYLREQSDKDNMDTDAPAQSAAGAAGAAAGGDTAMTDSAEGGAAEGAGAGGSGGGGGDVSEESVANLVQMGFTREQAVMALRTANGNAELAASLLFGGD